MLALMMFSVALRGWFVPGRNVSEIVQDDPTAGAGGRVFPAHVLPTTAKSVGLVPVIVVVPAAANTRFAVPVFVTVIGCGALVVSRRMVGKVRGEGVAVIAGTGATPEPARLTVRFPPSVVMFSVPVFAPAVLGLKDTPIVQVAPGATGPPQPLLRLNTAPAVTALVETPVTLRFAFEPAAAALVTVTFWMALVRPFPTLPKLRLAGFREATGTVPVPDALITRPPPAVVENCAERRPAAVGVNVIAMVQEPVGAMFVQLLELMPKSPDPVPVLAKFPAVSVSVANPVSPETAAG